MLIKKMQKYSKKNWQLIVAIALALVFFIGTSSFNYLTQTDGFTKWLSPDESANYVFAKLYSQEGDLRITEKYNLYVGDIMHPRSFRSDQGELKPISFLGLPLIYGKIASLTSYKVIPYLTPFFASLGLVFFYLLVRKIFGPRNAFISVFLLASFPPYIYYSARSMFHNVFFITLVMGGLYLCLLMRPHSHQEPATNNKKRADEKRQPQLKLWQADKSLKAFLPGWLAAAGAGSLIGLAIAARSSELLWLLPLFLVIWLFNFKKIGVARVIIFIVFIYIAMLPVFYWNQILYGFPYFGGYNEMNTSLAGIAETGSTIVKSSLIGDVDKVKELAAGLKNYIFYFGFRPEQSLKMFYLYFIDMFTWLFWPAVFGALFYYGRIKKIKKRQLVYLAGLAAVILILVFYYGSWEFYDNPDRGRATIGNSYTRYWLPIYSGCMPLAAWFLMVVTRKMFIKKIFKNNKNRIKNFWRGGAGREFLIYSLRVLAVGLLVILSVRFAAIGSEEGLYFSHYQYSQASQETAAVLDLTEGNAVIITQYHDKWLFPERKVVVGLFDNEEMIKRYLILAKLLPVYYYNFNLPAKDIEYLNTRRLASVGLRIKAIKKFTSGFTLYRLEVGE